MSQSQLISWVSAIKSEDLAWHGIEQFDETPQQALERLAEEMDVDLMQVHACLELLREGGCMLVGGAPLALMSYSQRRGVFKAAFDGDLSIDLDGLSLTRAGIWLTLLAGDAGTLPSSRDHWLVATFEHGRIVSHSEYVASLANRYAQMSLGPAIDSQSFTDLDLMMGRAIWRCAAHHLR